MKVIIVENEMKVKKITAENAIITTNGTRNCAIIFTANGLPKNAVIDTIKVDGRFLEDIGCGKVIEYHRERTDDNGWRDIATVSYLDVRNFNQKETQDFIDLIDANVINSFEVYYHEEAVTEVE